LPWSAAAWHGSDVLSPVDEQALRVMAISHISALERRHGVLPWARIAEGFEFRGQRVFLASKAKGIFKPSQLSRAALSVRTGEPRTGRAKRYDDELASQRDYFLYRYQDAGPDAPDNRSVRACMEEQLPLVYFYGVAPTLYRPIICMVAADDRIAGTFSLQPISGEAAREIAPVRMAATPIERAYAIREVKQRLHQDRFSEVVREAYGMRCAICQLRHRELLDAAHIIGDKEELGRPEVPNGLALCKLHHAAFDSQMLGIDPDLRISLRDDLLAEKDGPMLEHGLRGFHGKSIHTPNDKEDWPDRDLLALRWGKFVA
jgi:putative restriction endonuclease